MKVSTLAVLSIISFSQAYAFDISDTCDITRNQIKDVLNQKTLSIRKAEREILRMLSPQIDQRKMDDLIQDVKDNEYVYENEVISFSEIQKLKELESKKWASSWLPSEKELSRYKELIYKSEASDSDLKEMQALAKKIQDAKIFGFKPMTESEKTELSELSVKSEEHRKRRNNAAQAELNLNNYIRSEVLIKVSTSQETEISNNGILGTTYTLKNQNINIKIEKDRLDQKEVSISSFDNYFSYPLYMSNIPNRAGENEAKRFYDIFSYGKSLDISLTPSLIKGENEYNKTLKEIALNSKKTWTDFGWPGQDGGWGVQISKEIVDIAGDVKSSLDLATGKISVHFRTMIFNKDGNWLNFPEEYVSLEEMTELLLPKECRPAVKEVSTNSSVSDVSRNETKKLDPAEPKKGFFKKLFGGKKALNQ